MLKNSRACVSLRLDRSMHDSLCTAVSTLSILHVDLRFQCVNHGPERVTFWVLEFSWWATTFSSVVEQTATLVLRPLVCSAMLLVSDRSHRLSECNAFVDLRAEWCTQVSVTLDSASFWACHSWPFQPTALFLSSLLNFPLWLQCCSSQAFALLGALQLHGVRPILLSPSPLELLTVLWSSFCSAGFQPSSFWEAPQRQVFRLRWVPRSVCLHEWALSDNDVLKSLESFDTHVVSLRVRLSLQFWIDGPPV